jgi:hypothetical protein
MAKLLAFAIALAACSGSAPPSPPVDAMGALGAFGATCQVTSDMSTECTSGVCTNTIDQLGHDVCSQKCTVGVDSTCPVGSAGQKCNGKGYCKP